MGLRLCFSRPPLGWEKAAFRIVRVFKALEEGAKALEYNHYKHTLLPLQGAFAAVNLPRALPWAMRWCPFFKCLEPFKKTTRHLGKTSPALVYPKCRVVCSNYKTPSKPLYLNGFRLIFHPFRETSTIQPSNSKISNVKCPNTPICAERIRLFQEHKQIIINDVVTGKVKVSRNLWQC